MKQDGLGHKNKKKHREDRDTLDADPVRYLFPLAPKGITQCQQDYLFDCQEGRIEFLTWSRFCILWTFWGGWLSIFWIHAMV